jgi:hypothetical protein
MWFIVNDAKFTLIELLSRMFICASVVGRGLGGFQLAQHG